MQFNAIYGPPWPPTPNPENWQAACFIIMPEHMQNLVAAPQRTTTLIKSGNNAHFRFNCACECVCVCLCVCVALHMRVAVCMYFRISGFQAFRTVPVRARNAKVGGAPPYYSCCSCCCG